MLVRGGTRSFLVQVPCYHFLPEGETSHMVRVPPAATSSLELEIIRNSVSKYATAAGIKDLSPEIVP